MRCYSHMHLTKRERRRRRKGRVKQGGSFSLSFIASLFSLLTRLFLCCCQKRPCLSSKVLLQGKAAQVPLWLICNGKKELVYFLFFSHTPFFFFLFNPRNPRHGALSTYHDSAADREWRYRRGDHCKPRDHRELRLALLWCCWQHNYHDQHDGNRDNYTGAGHDAKIMSRVRPPTERSRRRRHRV